MRLSRILRVSFPIILLFATSFALLAQRKKPDSAPHNSGSSSSGSHQSSQPSAHQASPPASHQPSGGNAPSGRVVHERSPREYTSPNATRQPQANTTGGNQNPAGSGRQFGQQPSSTSRPQDQPRNQNAGRVADQQRNQNAGRVADQQRNQNAGRVADQQRNQNQGGNNRPGNNSPNVYGGPRNNPVPNSRSADNNARPGGFGGRPGSPRPEVVRTRSGGEIRRAPGGEIREVRTPGGAVIHHAPGGERRVEMARPGGRVVVANSRGSYGYVQRPIVVRNTTYIQRTYVVGGVSYARVYRPYVWGGLTFHVYTPVHYYRPAFYSWAWNPWPRPVYYTWGWRSRPWWGFYAGWFEPYPYYSSPALWLTDYLIASTLEQAYEARMERAAQAQANYAQTPLTPDVKQAISEEVRRQIDQERAEQQGRQGASFFSDNQPHVFVVASGLNVNDGGMGCALTPGDVLRTIGPPMPNSQYADAVVLASKPMDCRKGARVEVALNELQEMQNQMRATVDQGMGEMQSRQGQGGMPTLPASAAGTTDAPFASEVRPDANATGELQQAAQEADRAEQDVVGQADSGQTVNISLGMSIADVERALGRPREIADLGSKKIYVYKDMKVVFVNGQVSDVQ